MSCTLAPTYDAVRSTCISEVQIATQHLAYTTCPHDLAQGDRAREVLLLSIRLCDDQMGSPNRIKNLIGRLEEIEEEMSLFKPNPFVSQGDESDESMEDDNEDDASDATLSTSPVTPELAHDDDSMWEDYSDNSSSDILGSQLPSFALTQRSQRSQISDNDLPASEVLESRSPLSDVTLLYQHLEDDSDPSPPASSEDNTSNTSPSKYVTHNPHTMITRHTPQRRTLLSLHNESWSAIYHDLKEFLNGYIALRRGAVERVLEPMDRSEMFGEDEEDDGGEGNVVTPGKRNIGVAFPRTYGVQSGIMAKHAKSEESGAQGGIEDGRPGASFVMPALTSSPLPQDTTTFPVDSQPTYTFLQSCTPQPQCAPTHPS
ncbi:hypothetical protein CC86DRAFT_379828 [Ophiobolus disseminans]|uniref:Uncharacterized protein n=1 Tax=Ophiobolus disseminans TaxID=1469910 RepID=A0A6A7A8N6_9PLEO|nr:hypothetical protein CC86DRAFT_379828 [Ophiobolus disseminans]